ncbi:TPA: YSIRK-type signal peptide-containing protein, partial [Staphylococcus aureus]|nr:YSIRK-type signal peptide-containing protein [Staphylococcus aureus]
MKKSKKRLDFLPNKLNKYSIRRFSVGTASILVGATLLFEIN